MLPDFCRELRERMPLRGRADRLTWYLALFLESRLLRDQALAEYERLGAIPARCWRVAVPFDNQHGQGMATVYPPEERVALDDPDVGKDGRRIRWQCPWSEGLGYEIDFVTQIEVNVFLFEWAVGYAALEIVSPKKQEVVFRFGASGWCQLWLNGEFLALDRVFTGVPDAASVPLKLKRGRNELLMKVGVQEAGPTMRGEFYYWSLFSRITDNQGEPIRDLEFPMAD